METGWFYNLLAVLLAAGFCSLGFGLAVAMARRGWTCFVENYPKWLVGILVWAAVAPFMYIWAASPSNISYSDAALLHVRFGGWRYVLDAYAALAGIIVGGIVGALLNVLLPVENHDG